VKRWAALLPLFLAASPSAEDRPGFHNIAASAGLTATFPNGGAVTKEFIVETTGSGIAMLDYDNDGLLDIFVLSGPGGTNRMYHNLGHDRFEDVTSQLGLDHAQGWAQGVCAGDYDNDGFTDLFVTYYGQNTLYRNLGGRRFADVTKEAGLEQDRTRYNTGCAFLDYDRDGKLDLFVATYLKFDPKTTPKPGENPYCFYRGLAVACGPRGLPFDRHILYHNEGGRFRDVSKESGIAAPGANYGLGVLVGDFDGDGWPDIYVACDQTPSVLYMNKHDGTFEDEALLRGVAFDENGRALSGMGAAAADTSGNDRLDIFRTNFSDERETLYRNQGHGEFEDMTRNSGMGNNTRYVGWGCGFLDLDNDGWKDLLLVNGHVFPEVERLKNELHYKERAIVYRHDGRGGFGDISDTAGPAIQELHAARGAAFGDIDNDGAVEIAVNNQNEAPSLWKQSGRAPGHWILVQLEGVKSNRSAIGARVRIVAAGRAQMDEVRSGGSYLSQSDLRLHFGLGKATKIDRLEITWPSGMHQSRTDLPVDRIVRIREAAPV
jgi:hypothetical protein